MQIKFPSYIQIQFPHFHRIIAAPRLREYLLFFFWLFFLAVILLNLFSFSLFQSDTEKKLNSLLLRSPYDSNLHEELGEYLIAVNEKRAQEEYLVAQELYIMRKTGSSSVLGQQDPPEAKWEEITTEKETYEKQIQLWERVFETFPDYTYAWIKLAILYHQLDKDTQSQKYIQRLEEEGSYNKIINNLIQRIKSAKESNPRI